MEDDDGDHLAVALFNLGGIAQARGNIDEAESFFRESLAIAPHADEEMHLDWATTPLAWILAQKGEYTESEDLFTSAVASRRSLLGNDHPFVADALLGLGVLTSRQLHNQNAPPPGDCTKAVQILEEAAAIYSNNYREEAVQVALPRLFSGACLTVLERYEEAEQQLLAAYPILEPDKIPIVISFPPGAGGNRSLKLLALQAISYLYEVWGKPEKAAEYRKMLDL